MVGQRATESPFKTVTCGKLLHVVIVHGNEENDVLSSYCGDKYLVASKVARKMHSYPTRFVAKLYEGENWRESGLDQLLMACASIVSMCSTLNILAVSSVWARLILARDSSLG